MLNHSYMCLYVVGHFMFQVLVGGRERSAKEYEGLVCTDSLFELDSALPSKSEFAIFSFVKI